MRVTHEGYEPIEGDFTSARAGGGAIYRVDLVPRRPRAAIVVVVSDATGAAIRVCSFGLWLGDSASPVPILRRTVDGTDNRFRLDDLEPGHYRVLVRPGGALYAGNEYWTDATTTTELLESGDVELRVTVARGGRLRLTVTDSNGGFIGSHCRIRDASGQPIDAVFPSPDGVTLSGTVYGPQAHVDPVLPPGRYSIEISADHFATQTVDALVRANETTDVIAALLPR
ncbi:MAG: carboxypeptidase regulatory-like domain-containing protein [Planctomycetes bacterium]|nr:carboxypeptidase regulatory-like domain-containing protein [Planctomycetota bacterium]MBI3847395.1 carboxypeptidase regulatory-like domain-containing protein [Planctomycetota bacterium]